MQGVHLALGVSSRGDPAQHLCLWRERKSRVLTSPTHVTTLQALGWALTLHFRGLGSLALGTSLPTAAAALVLSQTLAEDWLRAELQGQKDSGSGDPGVH